MFCHKWYWFVSYYEHSLTSVECEWSIILLSYEFLFDCVHYLKTADWKWPLAGPRLHFPFPPIETQGSTNNCFCGSSHLAASCATPNLWINRTFLSLTKWASEDPQPYKKKLFPLHPALSFLLWPSLGIMHLKSQMYAKHSFWVTMIS